MKRMRTSKSAGWPLFVILALVLSLGSAPAWSSSGGDDDQGKAVYEKACKFCHSTGVMGSPKLGDQVEWKNRIAQGMDTLVDHSINGYQGKHGKMPPRGGNPDLTDAQVKAAVHYLVEESK